MLIRMVDDEIDDGGDSPIACRLFTTITDLAEASAEELGAAYIRRWEIELAFDELKTHQRGPRTVLRSKSPDFVLQEIWGYLRRFYVIRVPRNPRARAPAVPRGATIRREWGCVTHTARCA